MTACAFPRLTRFAAACGYAVSLSTASLAALAPAPALAVVEIAPHEAIYRLSLAGNRGGGPVVGLDGRMSFSWNDVCDGWTIEQRFQAAFQYAEGSALDLVTTYVTWEAKDGSSYRFNVRKQTNGNLDEELRGRARLNGVGGAESGGEADYDLPADETLALPPGTIFPTAHTIRLLELAQAGEVFFARPLFDGSEAGGAATLSAVIGRKVPVADLPTDDPALATDSAWRIELAFYAVDGMEMLPDYQSNLVLLANGIVQSMEIDYGDFRMKVELEALKAAPRTPC